MEVTKLPKWRNVVSRRGIIITLVLVPLYFDPRLYSGHVEAKLIVLKLALSILLPLWIVKSKKVFSQRTLDPLKLILAINLIPLLTSFLASVNQYQSFFGAYNRGTGLLTYSLVFLFVVISCEINKETLIKYMSHTGTVLSIYGIYQVLFEGVNRAYSTVGNPIPLGAFLLLTISLAFYRCSWRNVVSRWIELILQCLCLFLTYTRGAYLGFALMVFCYLILSYPVRRKYLVPLAIPFLLPFALVRLDHVKSIEIRLHLWAKLFEHFSIQPFLRQLLGFGQDNLFEAFHLVQAHSGKILDKAHNQILEALITTGYLGLAAYFLTLAILTYILLKDRTEKNCILFSGLLGFFVQAQFGIDSVGLMLYFWLYVRIITDQNTFSAFDWGPRSLLRLSSEFLRMARRQRL